MEDAARTPVDLPHHGPTISYWQQPPSSIADLQTPLPASADYVIVGSGISGVSIALEVLQRCPGARVVIIEARQACSGATGRNGGHTKAASYRSFLEHERELGTEEAVKIAKLEYANIKATHNMARKHDIDCASLECDTVDIIYSQSQLDKAVAAIKRMKEVMGNDAAARYTVYNAQETETMFKTPGALSSFQYAAGSLSAYALTTGLLQLATDKGAQVTTNTCVTEIARGQVITSSGTITSNSIILATNGYTAKLLPQMQGLIVPLHGQVVAQRPGVSLSQQGLPVTYSFIYESGYEYMITRPAGSRGAGHIIIGGGIHQLPNNGASRYGNTDDSVIDPTIANYLRGCAKTSFGQYWGDDNASGRIVQEWSGIMGATADGLPYVGQVPDMPGVWICAGFNGHGMVLCLKAAEALASLMIDGDSPAWFPQSFLVTAERMKTAFNGRKDLKAPGEPQFGERSAST